MIARILPAVACLALLPFAALADDGPTPEIPELAALLRYVGEFDIEVTQSVFGLSTGEGTAHWTLGGRFLEQEGTMTATDGSGTFSAKSLYTYDSQARVYRSWTFTSTGVAIERTGTFDAATQTLTLESTAPASRQTADFSDPEKIEWSIISIAADGAETVLNRGVSTRKE